MNELPLSFHPDARLDVLEAHAWYGKHSRRAAELFERELLTAGRAIQESPERWAKFESGTRRCMLKRFPYYVVYRVALDRIEVLAVAHGRRKPGYWKHRLKPQS